MKFQRSWSRVTFTAWILFAGMSILRGSTPVRGQDEDNCSACHRQQNDNSVVTIFKTSTHSKVGITCDRCHGGDAAQTEKTKAHAAHFVAKFDTPATLEMCGRCHRQPLEFFKASRHVAARPNAPRLDCVECHGVHAIGAYSESFRWTQFCAGCHGLEYLPALPRPFREMLALVDDLNDGVHQLEEKSRPPSSDLIQRRKVIRHLISELVHQTDAKSGADSAPHILQLGNSLRQQISTEARK